MDISGFTTEALDAVKQMLYAENPYEGKCGQKKLREQAAKPRTPAQEQADEARSQALTGKSKGGDRSGAAKKSAETRRRCKGGGNNPGTVTV